MCSGSRWRLSWRSRDSSSTGVEDTRAVGETFSSRRFALAVGAFSVVLLLGMVGYHAILGEAWAAAERDGVFFVEGDATRREDLDRVGFAYAHGIVAASDSDVDNLYLVLSAHSERPELLIVARASTEDAAEKLKLAGADRIV